MQNNNKNGLKKRAFKPYILLQAVHLCTQMRKNGKSCSRQIFRFCLLRRPSQTLRTEISFLNRAPNRGFFNFCPSWTKVKKKNFCVVRFLYFTFAQFEKSAENSQQRVLFSDILLENSAIQLLAKMAKS